jgi:hypothetical protein
MRLPTIKACLVCEDVRFEQRSLVTATGVFGAVPDVVVRVTHLDRPAKMCFAFFGAPVTAKVALEVEIREPGGRRLAAESFPRRVDFKPLAGDLFAAFWFNEVVFGTPNKYTIVLKADGTEAFSSTFNVTSLAPMPPSASPPANSLG